MTKKLQILVKKKYIKNKRKNIGLFYLEFDNNKEKST